MTAALPWREVAEGLELRVRLTPKSSRDCLEGIAATAAGPALKARVRAVPEDGKANAALEALVADWLDVPRRSVTVTAGGKSRIKVVSIDGDGAALAQTLAARLVAQDGGDR